MLLSLRLHCFAGLLTTGLIGGWWLNTVHQADTPPNSASPPPLRFTPAASADSSRPAQPSWREVSDTSRPSSGQPGWRGQQEPEDAVPPTFPERTSLVQDWQQPTVTLFVTGNQSGYIEPCGCTGLENQKGGLMRRADCQKILADRGWDLVGIDAGRQLRRVAVQANKKLQATYQTLCRVMNYDVIALGPEELKLSGTDLAQALVDSAETANPFTSANITVLDDSLTNRFRIIEKNGKRIGVTTLVGDEFFDEIQSPEITKVAAAQALARVVPALQQARCDMLVLVAQAKKEQCIELAKRFPVFDLIITGDGAGEPTMLPEKIAAGDRITQLIEVGTKGMYVGLVGCDWPNGKLEIRYERVPMDARFTDLPAAKQVFISYQDQLKQLYLSPRNFPDITPRKTPSGGAYVGSEACADCHEEDYEIWKDGIDGNGGPHFRATLDLTDPVDNPRAEIKRNFDPECLSCHVTGWNPQKYFPYETGYYDLERDRHLHGNGCENCHGPARKHVEAENGDIDVSEEEIERLRKALYITKEEAAGGLCLECHDIDNSPDFLKKGFEEYWKHIEHGN